MRVAAVLEVVVERRRGADIAFFELGSRSGGGRRWKLLQSS